MLEAVVPVSNRVEVRRNLDRLEMGLKSLSFFWKGQEALQLHVVVPDAEYDAIFLWMSKYENLPNLRLSLISESDISPTLASISSSLGVLKQMLIKLAAFDFVKADFCLLLDSDVVACKPFSADQLIVNGRIVTEWKWPSQYPWWFESARILGYPVNAANPEALRQPRIFVTPQILSRKIVEPLLEEIANRLGTNWMTGLITEYSGKHPNVWTEYTLYDLYADRNGLRETYHIGPHELPNSPLHCLKQSIWGAGSFEMWQPERALTGIDPGYFMVLQSITAMKLDLDLVTARWEKAIQSRFKNYPS